MSSPMSVLSRTLQNISLSKIRELDSRRASYEARKQAFLNKADTSPDPRDRLSCLLDGCRELAHRGGGDHTLDNIERWLAQSKHDVSIPESKLAAFDSQLRSKLDVQSRRLDMAHLYSRLLTEWMEHSSSSSSPSSDSTTTPAPVTVKEIQRNRLKDLIHKFESVVFTPLETSESKIHAFLDNLFPSSSSSSSTDNSSNSNSDKSLKHLQYLRERISTQTTSLITSNPAPFTSTSLTPIIKGLLREDILSDEKRAILTNFLESDVAKEEIADVLNMRFADLERWEWNVDSTDEKGGGGIPVMPRAGLNGKYRIWMDDDILQMIFVQFICVRICGIVKPALRLFMEQVWKREGGDGGHRVPGERDRDRRRYYLNHHFMDDEGVEAVRKGTYLERFFLSSLPESESALFEGGLGYDDDGDTDDGRDDDSDDEDDDDDDDRESRPRKKGTNIRQQLLRQLTADLYLYRLRGVTHQSRSVASKEGGSKISGGGPVALIQTDIQWFGTSIPHSTAYAVMRYLGFPEEWITFFKKYLEAPLNLDDALAAASEGLQDDTDTTPRGTRIRKRGLPMAAASEKLIGEMLLFCLDLAVHRETGILLYRLHDDIWLCGEPEGVARAWGVMQEYARVFGLEYNNSKTGSVYLPGTGAETDPGAIQKLPTGPVSVGFLRLESSPSGSGKWVIDQGRVKAHIDQLEKQLAECKSVLAWVQTWNTCIGRFFSHTFGEPAYCLGVEHVDAILDTYSAMVKRLLPPDGNVVEHVKTMIKTNLDLPETAVIPDAFIHLPEQLGGLNLRNPFVPLLLVRDNLGSKSPSELLDKFLRDEYDEYLEYKKTFDDTPSWRLRSRLNEICPDDDHDHDFESDSDSESESDSDEENDDSDSDSESETKPASTKTKTPPKKLKTILPNEANKFMTLTEYAYFREHTSRTLRDLYIDTLLSVPQEKGITVDRTIVDALKDALSPSSSSSSLSSTGTGGTPIEPYIKPTYTPRRGNNRRRGGGGGGGGGGSYSVGRAFREIPLKNNGGKTKTTSSLTPENKWFVALHAEELLGTYGGLSLVDKQFLPGGVLGMMREKKVTWQMVL